MSGKFEATVSVRLPDELLERLIERGRRYYRTPASMIREAIVDWLDAKERVNGATAPVSIPAQTRTTALGTGE